MMTQLKHSIPMHEVLLYGGAKASEQIHHPRLSALLDLWRARRGARPGPARTDFDILDFRPWFGHLMILEPVQGRDFRYRLYGAGLVDLFGFDLTRRTVTECSRWIGDRSLPEYQDVCRYRAPVYVSRASPASKQHIAVEKLALPLMEGTQVTQILAAIFSPMPAYAGRAA